MGVLTVGSVALDSIMTPFAQVRDVLGGSATFFSVAASYFTEVSIIAVVGKDFPKEHIRLFENLGINTKGLEARDGSTFRWAGAYGYDLNERDTIETRLNVFKEFKPILSEEHRRTEYLFLANIDPELQYSVLQQVESPRLTALDTMNFWIEGKREELIRAIGCVDALIMNDGECRQLAGTHNIVKAARRILSFGPRILVVKKGEHGALMFTENSMFSAPAFPVEDVFDPTGAGDSFAGGFMGYLAKIRETSEKNLREAVIYGTVMASFCVEKFSVEGMLNLKNSDIEERYNMLREVTRFGE